MTQTALLEGRQISFAGTDFPISPLSLDSLTRDYWGSFDAAIIAQLAPLCDNDCYQPKIYRAPAVSAEVFAGGGYVSYGLKITPGSIIIGFYLPPAVLTTSPGPGPMIPAPVLSVVPGQFTVQIRDMSLDHKFWDQPVPSYMLANAKLTYLGLSENVAGAFPNFLDCPYPVVGNGLFSVEIWEGSGSPQRIELVFGVLEAVAGCQ